MRNQTILTIGFVALSRVLGLNTGIRDRRSAVEDSV
jgi:hypothetical protein